MPQSPLTQFAVSSSIFLAEVVLIDLYTWRTPNGLKASIMLEEIEAAYRVHPIDIMNGAQFDADFLKISPNNKIPAIVDNDTDTDTALMESGAILLYLADKSGRLMPRDAKKNAAHWQVMQWLMFQMGGLGPMLGQAHHFLHFNPDVSEYAAKRYGDEAKRLYGVMDAQLARGEFLAGDYSIADIAAWPWIARFEWQGIDWNHYPNVKRWYVEIAKRPAVMRGFQVPQPDKSVAAIPMPAI